MCIRGREKRRRVRGAFRRFVWKGTVHRPSGATADRARLGTLSLVCAEAARVAPVAPEPPAKRLRRCRVEGQEGDRPSRSCDSPRAGGCSAFGGPRISRSRTAWRSDSRAASARRSARSAGVGRSAAAGATGRRGPVSLGEAGRRIGSGSGPAVRARRPLAGDRLPSRHCSMACTLPTPGDTGAYSVESSRASDRRICVSAWTFSIRYRSITPSRPLRNASAIASGT